MTSKARIYRELLRSGEFIVAPGVYDESVDLRGKAILVKSDIPDGATVEVDPIAGVVRVLS